MKIVSLSAITLAAVALATSASAQSRTEPAGKLFFEGDIVRHAIKGQQGPFCILNNRFTRGEAVAFRQRVLKPDGSVATDKDLKSVDIELGNGTKVPLKYHGHGMPPTDFFWSAFYTIPMDAPTGSVGYKVVATMDDGSQVTWQPFTRDTTQLMVVAGTPPAATAQ